MKTSLGGGSLREEQVPLTDTPDLTLFPEAALLSLTLGLKVDTHGIAQKLVRIMQVLGSQLI